MSTATKKEVILNPPLGQDELLITLLSGHSKLIKRNDGKGTSVPARFIPRAMSLGCLQPGVDEYVEPEGVGLDQRDIIITGFAKLTQEDYNDDGRPNLAKFKKATSLNISRTQLDEAWDYYQEQLNDEGDED